MAFSQSNSRELQNRKILEELQLKKQMLLKQGVAPTLNTSLAVTSTGSASTLVNTPYTVIRQHLAFRTFGLRLFSFKRSDN